MIDSYEVGDNNWTDDFRDEFIKRRGYDPIPFLPTLSGRYVDSGEMTERFLWDFRRTLCDLFAENYYNRFAELCHQHHLKFSVEPYDGPFECLQVGTKADIVMGEFWATTNLDAIGAVNTVKLAASVANTHGTPIVGAESFTGVPGPYSNWLGHPGMLKPEGRRHVVPGTEPLHFPYLRPSTVARQSSRHDDGPVGDAISGGRTPGGNCRSRGCSTSPGRSTCCNRAIRSPTCSSSPAKLPPTAASIAADLKAKGYDYDVIGTDLIMKLSVKDGRIRTPVGGSYRLLVLPDTQWMTPALAKKVAALVKAGARVLGPKPKESPSLVNYPACDAQVKKIADEVWGTTPGEHRFGRGKVITGRTVEDVLASENVQPDFAVTGDRPKLDFIHRATNGADIYFVANPETFAPDGRLFVPNHRSAAGIVGRPDR